jgi:uncharacterized membrane protein YiaA
MYKKAKKSNLVIFAFCICLFDTRFLLNSMLYFITALIFFLFPTLKNQSFANAAYVTYKKRLV